MEGAHGERAQARSASVEKLLAAFSSPPVDLSVARARGRLSAAPAMTGASVGANDLWIGAMATAHGLEALALDAGFDRIPGLARASLA